MKKPHKYPAKDNPKAKKEQLKKEWEEMLKRHSKPLECGAKAKGIRIKSSKPKAEVFITTPKTKDTFAGMRGVGAVPREKVYTGTSILGIATSHKSNLIPVFSAEHAVDLAHMRR